jgi:glycosyltransferase involved in cell wall biosynthesis
MRGLTSLMERLTFGLADRVISSSEALRRIAIERGGVLAERVSLVRSGIDLSRFGDATPDPSVREGRDHLVLYLGIIGSQDGVDLLLHAVDHFVHAMRRNDALFVIAGDGPALAQLREMARSLDIDEHLRFTGYVKGTPLHRLLASADIGVCPDPANVFNDKLSMNKIMEYQAYRLPVVLFDLNEGGMLAGEGGVIARDNDPVQLAERVAELLDDPDRRARMGAAARARVEAEFAWPIHAKRYVALFDALC